MERDNKYVGCRYQTKNCGEVEVISYKSYSKVEILFLQTGNIVTTNMGNVKLGQVRDRSFGNISGGCSLGKLELKTELLYKKSYVTWEMSYLGATEVKRKHTLSVKCQTISKTMKTLRSGGLIK